MFDGLTKEIFEFENSKIEIVDSREKLTNFVEKLEQNLEFQVAGVDIESHMPSHKSYEGFVCLL